MKQNQASIVCYFPTDEPSEQPNECWDEL